MRPDTVEDAIVAHLSPLLSGVNVDVVATPDTDADLVEVFDRGRVTVCYHSSTYDGDDASRTKNHRAMGVVAQRQEIDLMFILQAPLRRGPGGVIDQLVRVRKALLGWSPPGMGKLYAVRDDFQGREDGVWMHTLTLRGLDLVREVVPAEGFAADGSPLPRITTITHEGLS
jgi:hypothetical protein